MVVYSNNIEKNSAIKGNESEIRIVLLSPPILSNIFLYCDLTNTNHSSTPQQNPWNIQLAVLHHCIVQSIKIVFFFVFYCALVQNIFASYSPQSALSKTQLKLSARKTWREAFLFFWKKKAYLSFRYKFLLINYGCCCLGSPINKIV